MEFVPRSTISGKSHTSFVIVLETFYFGLPIERPEEKETTAIGKVFIYKFCHPFVRGSSTYER
jgi:hypothetical protein